MYMQLQASKSALYAIVLLLAVLLALSGVMFGGAVLASRATTLIVEPESQQPCSLRGVRPVSLGQTQVTPELERSPLNSSHIQQDPTYLGETPC